MTSMFVGMTLSSFFLRINRLNRSLCRAVSEDLVGRLLLHSTHDSCSAFLQNLPATRITMQLAGFPPVDADVAASAMRPLP